MRFNVFNRSISSVRSLFVTNRRRGLAPRLTGVSGIVETLENRVLLASAMGFERTTRDSNFDATIEDKDLAPSSIQQGTTNILVSMFDMTIDRGVRSRFEQFRDIIVIAGPGSVSLDANVASVSLLQGTTVLATATPNHNVVAFYGLDGFIGGNRDKSFSLRADMLPSFGSPQGSQISFEVAQVNLFTLGGSEIDQQYINYSGTTSPTQFTLQKDVQEAATLSLDIDGPPSTFITPDANDVVFANLTYSTTGGGVDVDNIFVAFEGRKAADNSLVSDVASMIEDVEFRVAESGAVIDASFVASYDGLSIYRFSDFVIVGAGVLEIRADLEGADSTGVKMRVHVVTEPSSSETMINIGGLTGSTTDYRVQAVDIDADTVAQVRPGGVISGNFQVVKKPELSVAVKAMGESDAVVQNEKKVPLFTFEARANEVGDLLFTQAIFEAQSGSLYSGQSYGLEVDTDGDNIPLTLESGVVAQSNQLIFNNIPGGGFVISAGTMARFTVFADIAASPASDTLQLKFATGVSDFVAAEELRTGASLVGIDVNSNTEANAISVTTTDAKLYTIVSNGNLFVTKDSTPVRSRDYLAGALGEAAVRVQLFSEFEDSDIVWLRFLVTGEYRGIDRFELYVEGATTPFAIATIGGTGSAIVPEGGMTFTANMQNQQLVVKEGSNVNVIVRPLMKKDVEGAVSGDEFRVTIDPGSVIDGSTGEGAIYARGVTSSSRYNGNDGDSIAEGEVFIGTNVAAPNVAIVGNLHKVVLSKIVSITNANPDADGTSVPTGVSPVGQFKFTAAANFNTLNGLNKAVLDTLVFRIDAENVLVDDIIELYSKADSTTKVGAVKVTELDGVTTWTGPLTGSFLVHFTGLAQEPVNVRLDSGSSSTIVVEVPVLDVMVSETTSSSLRVSLPVNATSIIWVDMDATTSTIHEGVEYPETIVYSTNYYRS